MDTGAMADEIRSQGNRDFDDPQDVHDTLTGMHELVAALQETLHGISERLAETGVHPVYSQAAAEASQAMGGIADELQSVTAGGVMQGPGGG